MDELQARVARIALAACPDLDYALGGGLAVVAHGLIDRPTEDIDLFCTHSAVARTAAERISAALEDDGLLVHVDIAVEDFARLLVEIPDGGTVKLELVRDYRAHPPVRLDIGPVLHPDDAVANKMGALFGRWYPRDYLDVDAALTRYSRSQLLDLAAAHDPGFDLPHFRDALAELNRLPDSAFTSYGISTADLAAMRQRFAAWSNELSAPQAGPERPPTAPIRRPTTRQPRPASETSREPPCF
ncbi:MAG: nucleotidyl transferase AbiEii/AbiGii toxin family protein [Acidothermaceae bacterium]